MCIIIYIHTFKNNNKRNRFNNILAVNSKLKIASFPVLHQDLMLNVDWQLSIYPYSQPAVIRNTTIRIDEF